MKQRRKVQNDEGLSVGPQNRGFSTPKAEKGGFSWFSIILLDEEMLS